MRENERESTKQGAIVWPRGAVQQAMTLVGGDSGSQARGGDDDEEEEEEEEDDDGDGGGQIQRGRVRYLKRGKRLRGA